MTSSPLPAKVEHGQIVAGEQKELSKMNVTYIDLL